MNIEHKTKGMVEAAIIGSLTAIIVFAINLIPIVNILRVLIALPYIIVGKRRGSRYAMLSSLVTATLIGLFMNPLEGIYVLTLGGIVAFTIVLALELSSKSRIAIFAGTLATLMSIMIFISVFSLMSGINFGDQYKGLLESVLNESFSTYSAFGGPETDLTLLKETVLLIIPYTVVMMSLIHVSVNYFVARAILARTGMKLGNLNSFGEFSIPKSFIYGSLIILITMYSIGWMGFGEIDKIMVNVVLVFMLVYMINGMASLWWFGEKKKIPSILRSVLIIVLVLFGGGWLLAVLGLVDLMLNFRKIEVQ